jgi:hypothetical protein
MFHKFSRLFKKLTARQLQAVLIVIIIAAIGTYLLISGHAATPYASTEAEEGTLSGATKVADSTASAGYAVKFGSVPSSGGGTGTGSGGGNGTLIFDGTFNNGLTNFPTQYDDPGSLTEINSNEEEYYVTSADSLEGNEGHYRADLSSANIYPSGVAECTTIPFQFPDGLTAVPNSSFYQFAETKDTSASLWGWGMEVTSYYTGTNELALAFDGGSPVWTSNENLDDSIHTMSICTNNSNNSSGEVYGIWYDGVRQTFNRGSDEGKQSITGITIINDGSSSWPLDINDYTGGSPVPNEVIHGAPLVYTMGSNGLPPEPSGGWNSF